MPTRITTRRQRETAVIEVEGDLDLQAAPELAAAMAVARIECERLVLDLREVEFIDSTGLRELLGQQVTSDAAGRQLLLVRPAPPADRIFVLTQTEAEFHWVSRLPPGEDAEPLPTRVARHRTALRAIEGLAGDGQHDDVARLISDAVGDACVISRLGGGMVHPIAFVHRVREAERALADLLMVPSPVAGSSVLSDVAGGRGPVFLGAGDPVTVLPRTRDYQRVRGLAAIACLPLGPAAAPSGVLGCARDTGGDAYDAEDRVFLQRAARLLSTSSAFAAAASG